MEVLSVPNHHIQKQFGVIGSTKVKKDWASSLIPPPSRITPSQTNQTTSPATPSPTTNNRFYNALHRPVEYFDIVDGLNTKLNLGYNITQPNSNQPHSQHQPNCSLVMETAATASVPPNGDIEATGDALYTYNNNNNVLFWPPNIANVETSNSIIASNGTPYSSPSYGIPITNLTPSPNSSNLSTPTEATEHFGIEHKDIDAAVVNELSQRLQAELRAAKSRHLSCTEVSLPWDLTARIAADMIKTSEREPCGVRGCAVFIDFEDETGNARRIASFKVDPNTVSTFELFLTLKQDRGGWTSLLPQFLKNLTRSSTILISPHFALNKRKLYACE